MVPPIVHWLPPHLEPVSRDPFIDDLRPPVKLAFLFCDLTDLADYAGRRGDKAATAAQRHLAEVAAIKRDDGCGAPRTLLDGVMVICDDPGAAVARGARILSLVGQDDDLPRAHASVHTAVAKTDDGGSVARAVAPAIHLVRAAGADELVATRAVVDACGDRFTWQDPTVVHLGERRDEIRRLQQERRAA